jgi:hypothetical protein
MSFGQPGISAPEVTGNGSGSPWRDADTEEPTGSLLALAGLSTARLSLAELLMRGPPAKGAVSTMVSGRPASSSVNPAPSAPGMACTARDATQVQRRRDRANRAFRVAHQRPPVAPVRPAGRPARSAQCAVPAAAHPGRGTRRDDPVHPPQTRVRRPGRTDRPTLRGARGGHRAERPDPRPTQRTTDNLQAALVNRAVIDQAIGIIISRTGSNSDEAFDRIRMRSQKEHTKVSAVATRIVEEAARRARTRHHSGRS